MKKLPYLSLCLLILEGCSSVDETPYTTQTFSPPRATSRPYQINGVWYYPQSHYELDETGVASHYGGPDGTHGLPTATGERFNMFDLTAAHKTVPLPCVALITNLENGRRIKVKINDRGPFKNNRVLDLSTRAAQVLGFHEKGTALVRIQTLPEESILLAENVKALEKQGLRPTQLAQTNPQINPPPAPPIPSAVVAQLEAPVSRPLLPQASGEASIASLIDAAPLHPRKPVLETGVKTVPIRHPHLYVQAGARRMGPLKNVAEADRVLDQFLTSGHTEARIIIEEGTPN